MAARRLLIAFVLIAVASAGTGCESEDGSGAERVVIDGRTFDLEYAIDDDARTLGMGGRTEIPEGGGMLFVFPEADLQSFWMKDCLIDIDIIYLDARGTITAMHRMKAEPPRVEGETDRDYQSRLRHYSSVFPAQFAVELQAGTLDQLNLSVDDRIELDLERLKAMAKASDQ